MIRRLLALSCLLLSFTANAHFCSKERVKHPTAHKGTTLSPLEDQYDVQYVWINISLDNTNTNVAGNTTTQAMVTNPGGMSQYAVELNSNMTIDSARLNGNTVVPIRTGDLVTFNIGSTLAVNTLFRAQIYYHGTASNGGTGFFAGGIVQRSLPSGTNITYTMSDDYFAKDWWPAKQSLLDKIDSTDIWITVPAGTRAGSNGKLQQITPVGAQNRYEWKTRYPIDYYLISVAVAPYVDHTKMMYFSNSSDSMPVVHYAYDTATFFPLYRNALDSTGYMIDHFSTLFGRYPFWKEKYGHCTAPLSGGMEHQTMTTLGAYTTPLIAHELGHQWWGDCVTYSSWKDIWMSEGWASYCEQLYVEHFWSVAAAQTYRTSVFNRVMGQVGGTVYVYDTSNVLRTFDSRLTYDKGAAVAHMLRYVAPNDSTYFAGLKTYQQLYQFKNVNTEDFKAVMEQAYGYDLDTFFNQWVYLEGYPTYTPKWNQAGNLVLVQLNQTTSKPTSVATFSTPLEIRLTSAQGDTVVKVYSNAAQQTFAFLWPKTMTGLQIDPSNHILNKAAPATRDPSLAVGAIQGNNLRIYPNPARDSWMVEGIVPHSVLQLYSAGGQLVWEQKDATGNIRIPAQALPAGHYELNILTGDKKKNTLRLVRW